MDPEFVLTVCSACQKSVSMKNSYGVTALHCIMVNAPNFKACSRINNCPMGKTV